MPAHALEDVDACASGHVRIDSRRLSRSNILENMEHDFMKRGYLLPEGCKDLIDVLKLKPKQQSPQHPAHLVDILKLKFDFLKLMPQVLKLKPKPHSPQHPAPLPPLVGEIVIPEQTSASQLAALLGQKASEIIADVMQLGFFVTAKPLDFKIISSVARKYGFIAKRAA